MIAGLILTIGSLFFVLLLLVSYLSKQRFLSIRNKLYRYLLITALVLLITEIISAVYFAYGSSSFINLFLLKLHWSTGIPWFLLLYFYSLCFLKNYEASSLLSLIKNNKRCQIFLIFSIIYFFIYLFLPFKEMTTETFTYLPGIAAYYILIYCSISVIMIISFVILRAKEATNRKKSSTIIMIIEMIIVLEFQFMFPNIAFLGLGAAIQMFFLYFYIENPDLTVIAELENVKGDIEKSNKAKSDFLSNMSHEIRSPMNAIVGFSETILNDPNFDEESARTDIEHILRAGNNLLDIINNILDISKIESGKETLEMKTGQ